MPVQDLARRYLPDFIFGATDGVVTTLAVISGVVGASLSTSVILVLVGFANLLADGFSMGASNVLSRRSEAILPPMRDSVRHGIATFVGFVAAGLVPLLAYILPVADERRYQMAVVVALLTLFTVGASRALFTNRTALRAGAEMLAIGAGAAALAYIIGVLAGRIVGTVS
jgi:VIT1/CCC1 family predicted Fe2+/Mn2+ transporter